MKIRIEAKRYHFSIPVPVCFLSRIFSNRALASILASTNVPVSADKISLLMNELKMTKKSYGKFLLIDIKTKEGFKIKVYL